MIANPVLRKELLIRMRFGRQPKIQRIGIGLAIVLLLGFTYFKVFQWLHSDPSASSGHWLWAGVMYLQFTFLCLIAPIVAANSITQEREQQTWEMLIFTRLRPSEIIIGKLLARMVTVLLLLTLGLPVALLAAYHANRSGFGSTDYVSPLQFMGVYVTQLIAGLFYATFGLFMSWLVKRTLYAIMAAYTFVIGALIIGTTLVTSVLSSLIGDYNFLTKCPLMWFNPVQLIWEAVAPDQRISTLYLIYGLIGYAVLTGLMLWRMIAGFRSFSYEG